ncbi:alpha-fetoprotein-like isoform X2 [Marmota marmota marmota]|uniref:alpha-fetoprotein-like isoform X2 n=1 Tax=Marmota marmota marmota TaxID=9994 RepID=UPI0007623595|nr:alpha-fetoprotein-like isoform X2 [Marmota marmota marmota]
MKTLKPICFLVFFSYIKCQILQTSLLHAVLESGKSNIKMLADSGSAMQHLSTQNYVEENLKDLTSIMIAQFLQKATYEEIQTVAQQLLDLVEKCKNFKSHVSATECAHQLMTSFLEHICDNQGMLAKHLFTNCCNTNSTARLKCFLFYKKDYGDHKDRFQSLKPEMICEMDKENQVTMKERYSYEISRRHPYLYGPTILTMSACYKTAIQSCCQEENKTECLQIKLEPIRKYITEIALRHHHLCEIGVKFNHKVAKAVELVLLTKKQPKSNFSEVAKLTTDVKNLHETCCEGNTVACALGRSQLMNYTCSTRAALSSKITQCCELPAPFRGECIINTGNGDKPDLSSLPLSRFTEDQFVCQRFTDNQDDFLQEFLYEYSRRHPELAVPVILRVEAKYKNLLEKCCKLEKPLECYSHVEVLFQRVVRESCDHVKNYCDLHEKLGDSNFHDRLMVLYTKKAPQLSAQELVMFTKKMAAVASRCCPQSDEQQFFCIEDSAKLILGALCRRHEVEPINAGVGHCCDNSYAFRKPCFDDLQVDRTYVSPFLPCDQVIILKGDLCKAQKELQIEKQKLLISLVRQKPSATEAQFQSVLVDFTHLVEMCCHAEESDMCFQKENEYLGEKLFGSLHF